MSPEDLLGDSRAALLGRRITFIRLAANSLLIYVDGEPGDGTGLTFWLEPSWHIAGPAGVVAGSRQAQGRGDDGPTEEELERVLDALVPALDGRAIEAVDVDPRTRDLDVSVEGGVRVRTFATDPADDHSWHIRDNRRNLALDACPAGLRVRAVRRRDRAGPHMDGPEA